ALGPSTLMVPPTMVNDPGFSLAFQPSKVFPSQRGIQPSSFSLPCARVVRQRKHAHPNKISFFILVLIYVTLIKLSFYVHFFLYSAYFRRSFSSSKKKAFP